MVEYRKMFGARYSSPPPKLHVVFKGTDVAILAKEKGLYVFKYLESFSRLCLAPFPGLADVSKIYKSVELPRFFAERIPDLRRPEIREHVRLLRIPEHDELALLAALGRISVTDPFELVLETAA
jgi:HipA-like protein